MADQDKQTIALGGKHRITYAAYLQRRLHENNGGGLQWGQKYREFHTKVWTETARALKKDGVFVLNIKDHIRGGQRQDVTDWHIGCLSQIGFEVEEHHRIETPGMRKGRNPELRVNDESIIKLRKVYNIAKSTS